MAGRTVANKLGGRSQRLVFFLGLVLAAIAAVIVFAAVNGSDSGTSTGGTVPVVVAQQAIPADTRITKDMLQVEFVPAGEANADAFTARSHLVDRVVTEDVEAGAQVLPAMVSERAGDGLAFKVEPGMRGISVEVREVVTAGGNIKPGDQVDLVGIFEVTSVEAANHLLAQLGTGYTVAEPEFVAAIAAAPSSAAGEEEEEPERFVLTVTLLQNVKILGLAQTLTETTAGGTFAEDVEENADTEPRASTATLELTPNQAQMATTGDEYGIYRMDIRAPGDDAVVAVEPTLIVVEKVQ
jgi:Flp pilus assembly protein CpaB